MAAFLILSGIAVAATVLFTIDVAPNLTGWNSGTVYGNNNVYVSVIPDEEKATYDNRVWVYENNVLIWYGEDVVPNQLLIASYTSDARHRYKLAIQNYDTCTFSGAILYD